MLICVSLIFCVMPTAQASELMHASEDAIRILKLEEGFSSTPYWDYAQWTVGYGTKCPDDKLEEYKQNGITEEAAEQLLQEFVARFEGELLKFINKTGVQLNQNQFDALLLFSFNCGSSWIYDANGLLYQTIVSGATGSALINALSRWCNAGGEIKTFLLRRRLSEANIYLNGQYDQTPPENFGYVLYDANGGLANPNVQGFDTTETPAIIPTATYVGYTFDGWYTEKVGGTKMTNLDATVKNKRLYARWKDAEGNVPEQNVTGVEITVTANLVNLRKGPGTSYGVIGSANTGDKLTITETKQEGTYLWGNSSKGWICLKYTNYDLVSAPAAPVAPQPRMGTIKVNDALRVRSGPSTGYSVVGYLKNGDRVQILEQQTVGSMIWGKIDKGYISMDYVQLDPEKEPEKTPELEPTGPETTVPPTTQPPVTEPPVTEPPVTEPPVVETTPTPAPETSTWTGTVNVSDYLRIRSGPSTQDKVVGYLYPKEKVTITQQTTSGSMTWGKIDRGWISMDYILLDKQQNQQQAQQTLTGTVKVSDLLRVRTGPSTSYAVAGYLKNGAKVTVTETKTVGSTTWGKISNGWISLDYVKLDNQQTQTQPQKQTKTVTADCLRVRSDAGTGYQIVGYLYSGSKVEIVETKMVGSTTWGKISKGWISMDYVK